MSRVLKGALLVLASALLAWAIVFFIRGKKTPVPGEAPSISEPGPKEARPGSLHPALFFPKDHSKSRPQQPDPGPSPAPPSKKALEMEPAPLADWADERIGDLSACTASIDTCLKESLDALSKRGVRIPSLGEDELKEFFEVKVNDAIEYFEFVRRHEKRLEENVINRDEFYFRLTPRSFLFEAGPADILEKSMPEFDGAGSER